MRSLILKDLYNIGHNAKSMLFMLAVLAVVLIPTSGAPAYIIVSAILCSMMIVTTFTFDDNSKWTRYAMIMPFQKFGSRYNTSNSTKPKRKRGNSTTK